MTSFRKFVKSPQDKLNLKEINMEQLRKIYTKINKSNSTSIDKISMKTLCKLRSSTQPIFLNLINQVIKQSKFPESLKTAQIIPIIKNGKNDKLDPTSYRPVNLLSPISKIIEKTWSIQILEHIRSNKIIDNNHQGSIKGRNGRL